MHGFWHVWHEKMHKMLHELARLARILARLAQNSKITFGTNGTLFGTKCTFWHVWHAVYKKAVYVSRFFADLVQISQIMSLFWHNSCAVEQTERFLHFMHAFWHKRHETSNTLAQTARKLAQTARGRSKFSKIDALFGEFVPDLTPIYNEISIS